MNCELFKKLMKEIGIDLGISSVYTFGKKRITIDIEVDVNNESIIFCSAIIEDVEYKSSITTKNAMEFINFIKFVKK